MAFPKILASSLLALLLAVPCMPMQAQPYFLYLNRQTWDEIHQDSLITGLTVGALTGMSMVYYDVSNQENDSNSTFWQKLKKVNWAKVYLSSLGMATLSTLACYGYKYYNAPEHQINSITERLTNLKNELKSFSAEPLVSAGLSNDVIGIEKICICEDFPLLAAVDKIDLIAAHVCSAQSRSKYEVTFIKKTLEDLVCSKVHAVSSVASELLHELEVNGITEQFSNFHSKLMDAVFNLKNNSLYLLQLKEKAAIDLVVANAGYTEAAAISAVKMAEAQQKIAQARIIQNVLK